MQLVETKKIFLSFLEIFKYILTCTFSCFLVNSIFMLLKLQGRNTQQSEISMWSLQTVSSSLRLGVRVLACKGEAKTKNQQWLHLVAPVSRSASITASFPLERKRNRPRVLVNISSSPDYPLLFAIMNVTTVTDSASNSETFMWNPSHIHNITTSGYQHHRFIF